MFRRLGVLVIVTAALALGVLPGAPASAGSTGSTGSADGAVGVNTVTFVDRKRETPSDVTAGIAPASERRLPTTIYYPARGKAAVDGTAVPNARPRGGPFPIVLFAGGSPGTPKDYAELLQDWAAAGYVVVAPEFPVSSLAGPDEVASADLPNQSGDVRFVLRRVLGLDPSKARIPELDDDHIAVAGHSLGGQTALSLVAKCCRESRVDVALVLAGVTDASDGPALRRLRGPALFVHSRNDRAVPYGPTRETCATVAGWKRMLTVEDLRGIRAHITPYLGDDEYAAIVRPATVDFLDGYLRDDTRARRRLDRVGEGTDAVTFARCRTEATNGR